MPFQISHHCRFISTSLASVGCPGACCGLVVPVADRWNWINQLARFNSPTPAQLQPICDLHEITNQCVTVPKIEKTIPIPILFPVPYISNTDTGTFFGTKFFRYRFGDFFFDTKFDRYGFGDIFPVPNFSNTTRKMKNSRYRYLYDTGTHYKSSKFINFGEEN